MKSPLILGVERGWLEFVHIVKDRRESLTTVLGLLSIVVFLVIVVGDKTVPGTDVSRSDFMAPGFLALSLNIIAMMNLPLMIAADREEGTLLRVRVLPRGSTVYVVARMTTIALYISVQVLLFLAIIPLFTDLSMPSPTEWLTAVWILVLGIVSTVPLGVTLGCLLPAEARGAGGVILFPALGLLFVSGLVFPMGAMWEPLQWLAQLFPPYWQGLGLRSVFLSDTMLAAEIGNSWRLPQAAAVLLAWSVVGLLLAPRAVNLAARKESGSRLAAAEENRATRTAY